MPYSQSWVETDPDGGIITVSQLDNWIRYTKAALRERVEQGPDDPLTGIFEVGTFAAAPMPKAGSARIHAVLDAAVAALPKQAGRLAYATDTGILYHLAVAGATPIFYPGSAPTVDMVRRTFGANTAAPAATTRFFAQEDATYTYGYQVQNRNSLRLWGLAVDVVVDDGKFAIVDITGAAARLTISTVGLVSVAAMSVTGDVAASTGTFSGNLTGGTYNGQTLNATANFTGTLNAVGNFSVNTNKFTVTAASGNTAVAGTLNVTGVTTLGNVVFTGNPSTLKSGNTNGIELISTTSALLQQWYDNGPTFLNGVGTTASAVLGDFLIHKANAIRTANNAGTGTFRLIGYGATDKVLVDQDAKGVVCGYNLEVTGGVFDDVVYSMLKFTGGLTTDGTSIGRSSFEVQSTASITTAKKIYSAGSPTKVFVSGATAAGGAQFIDTIDFAYLNGSTVIVVSTSNLVGGPPARTYSNPAVGELHVASAGAAIYTRVSALALDRRN